LSQTTITQQTRDISTISS